MADVENDTEDGVDYSAEDGQGTSSFVLYQPLEPGQVVSLPLSSEYFNILFYRRGEREEPVVRRKNVPRDSLVRLRHPAPDHWEIQVEPAGAVAASA